MRYFIWLIISLVLFLASGCSDKKGGESVSQKEISPPASKPPVQVIEVKPIPIAPEDQEKGSKAPPGMSFVKGGCFLMGNDIAQVDERPAHEVCVDDFYMDKTEVTQKRWLEVMGFNPSKFLNENHPVEQVNYFDIQQFIKKSHGKCRLPTEAEWEYAAGVGIQANYYWGNMMDGDYAWFEDNAGKLPHPVAQKKANQFDLYDMLGNVWEWVDDWYENTYSALEKQNPKGPPSGEFKVIRGGSFDSSAGALRITNRTWLHPKNRVYAKVSTYGGNVNQIFNYIGFRCAMSIQEENQSP